MNVWYGVACSSRVLGQDGTAPAPAERRPAPRTRRTAHTRPRTSLDRCPRKEEKPSEVFSYLCLLSCVWKLGRQKPASLGFLAHGGPGERSGIAVTEARDGESLRHIGCEANERANAPDAGGSCCRIGESTGLFKRWRVSVVAPDIACAGSCTKASSHSG